MVAEYDVIIVGARVAGSIAAALLGDAGYCVLLVDRATFPSATLSTHFFRSQSLVAVLERLNVLEQVLALGSPRLIQDYKYRDGGEEPIVVPSDPSGVAYNLSVRREALDDLLVQRAVATQRVDLRERTRVTELLWENERVAGVCLASKSGNQPVRANLVIGADGRHSFVAHAVKAVDEEAAPPYRALYYCYVQGYPSPHGNAPDGPDFSFLGDEIAYTFPSDAGVTCIAISINLADFAWLRKDPTSRFRERIARHRGIAQRFAAAQPISSVMGQAPAPSYVRKPIGPGWALVGDAGMHQDPWSGHGMDMAGVHATFLAEAVQSWFSHAVAETEALATYHQRRNEHGLEIFRRTVRIAQDVRQAAPEVAPEAAP